MTSYVHTFNPQIAIQIGESESILLNQLEYWISKCGKNVDNLDGKWIYNSHEQWSEQFIYWSISKLRRTIKSLENLGLVKSSRVNSKRWNQTKWYSIDREEYYKLLQNKTESSQKSKIAPSRLPISSVDLLPIKSSNNVQIRNTKYLQTIPVSNQNTLRTPKVPMCSKWTDQLVQNEQFIITKNTHIKNVSHKEGNFFVKRDATSITTFNKKILRDMVSIWNKIFEYALFPIKAYCNHSNEDILLNVYKTIFQEDLKKWENYACKVNSSKFLMGEKKNKGGFKAVFHWLLRKEIIHSILNGAYGVGDRELDMDRINENLEKQEKELARTIKKKIMNCIKSNLDEKKEMSEFTRYVQDQNKKDDRYDLNTILRHYSSHSLLYFDIHEGLRKNLYEGYLLKKHLGISSRENKRKIEAKILAMKGNEGDRAFFKKIAREIKRVQRIPTVKESVKTFYKSEKIGTI